MSTEAYSSRIEVADDFDAVEVEVIVRLKGEPKVNNINAVIDRVVASVKSQYSSHRVSV